MELRVLRYFLALAREESVSAAANYLNLTQPTLSRQLIELEGELGVKLFTRSNRKITLTEEGLLLRKRAEEIVDLVQKTEAEFHAPGEIISGEVFIGGGETDSMRLVAQIAKELREKNPEIRFHLYSGNADDVSERLDKGLLDFGLFIGAGNISKYNMIMLPATDVWGVLMRKDCPLAQKETIVAEDLWELPIIMSRQTLVNKDFSSWFKRDFEAMNVVATYNLVYNASILVDEGVGYALALDQLVNTAEDSNLCFRPLEPRKEAGLYIGWKKYQVFSKASELFLSHLQQKFS